MWESLTISGAIFFLLDWILRLGFLFYVPRKRNPSSAIAWILVVLLLPGLGILLFLLIGSPKLSRRRREMQKQIDQSNAKQLKKQPDLTTKLSEVEKERYEPIINLGKSLSTHPLTSGNSVKVFPEYEEAIKEVTKAVKKAKSSVLVEYFIIAYDETTKPFFYELENAVKRGVEIKVLFDLRSRSYPNYKFMKKELTRIGADWRIMLPLKFGRGYNRPDLRNHRKIVVVDNQTAFMGSQNLVKSSYHRKDDIYYDELVVRLKGPIVAQCRSVFVADWYAETGEKLSKVPTPDKSGSVLAQLVPSGPNYEDNNNLQLFVQLIHSARKSITITNPYFIPDEALMTACTSAAKRGVEVTIINSEAIDQLMVGYAQRSYYEHLLEAGVNIHLYNSPIFLHSKHMTIDDDIAVVGSSNMDIRSFALDLECVVVLYDKKVVSDLKKVQKRDLERSSRLTLKRWQHRPVGGKFLESIFRLTSALQ